MLNVAIPGGNPGSLGWTDGPLLELLLLDESDGRPGSMAEPPLMAARPLPLPLKGDPYYWKTTKKYKINDHTVHEKVTNFLQNVPHE